MSLPEQISRYMSLREPQHAAVEVLDEISVTVNYKDAQLDAVAAIAGEKSRYTKPVQFDTEFPSFCFALATGVGKTRLMGACIYYLWKQKDYRNFFILAPNITIYNKLRAELSPTHPKYMFLGLSDFPRPEVYDGDNYLRFNPQQAGLFGQACVFIFNISKIFTARTDTEFKFHRFNEDLGNSFSAILQGMDDLVVLMDESHRYRGEASLRAINHLKPVLGLEFTATPLKQQKNVIYSFGLAQAIGRFVKTPTVVTRTNLTTSDAEEIEKLKLLDGMTRHEQKKGRLAEYYEANGLPVVKPFVLISTRDTQHAAEVRGRIESENFFEGHYKGKVIEIHSGKSGAESDANVQRLLTVEQPTSTVEIVIHVNMLKEGWDVRNLYTIIPLRASTSEILTEQTVGRGLRLPFGQPTGDPDLDALEIISHDQYTRLIQEARNNPLFTFKEINEQDLRPVKVERVAHEFLDLEKVLDRIAERRDILFTAELTDEQRLNDVVQSLVAEQVAVFERRHEKAISGGIETKDQVPIQIQDSLFPIPAEGVEAKPFDPIALETELKERLRHFARANIDVPRITTDTFSDRKLEPFAVTVNFGPFELVDQRVLAHELGSGRERTGERLEVMDIENPRAFLAGRLIDAVDEMDVANDKETALRLVDDYLAQLNKAPEELGKIVHLYRDLIIKDLKNQIEAHIQDETKVEISVRRGFIQFRPYSKTILAKDGLVPYTQVVPKSDIRRYLFDGFKKSFYPQVPFDSTPEKDFAVALERDPAVLKWIRPPDGNVPIHYRGRSYDPDFIVETETVKYVVEVKARKDLGPEMDPEVREKALAASRWCEAASNITGSKPWEYKLVPDDEIGPTRDLKFLLSHAVRVPSASTSGYR
jgi:type III restriction enzyme